MLEAQKPKSVSSGSQGVSWCSQGIKPPSERPMMGLVQVEWYPERPVEQKGMKEKCLGKTEQQEREQT